MSAQIIRYDIVDNKTGQVIASRKNRKSATNRANKLDLQYGAVRYIVKPVFSLDS